MKSLYALGGLYVYWKTLCAALITEVGGRCLCVGVLPVSEIPVCS